MTREEQAKIILREIDEVYSVSTYMEKYVINAIMAGLDEIYRKKKTGSMRNENLCPYCQWY